MKEKRRMVLHGEVALFEVKELPQTAKKIDIKKDYYVIGESGTHGNDHRVAIKDKVEVFEDENRIQYIKNFINTEVFCPNDTKHSTKVLRPCIWEIGHAQQTDHLTGLVERVRD